VTTVAVTGAAGHLGRRVIRLLAASPEVDGVVALDVHPATGGPGISVELVDVAADPAAVRRALAGVDAVVHLGSHGEDPGDELARRRDRHALDNVLSIAAEVGVHHVVLLSSSAVYGAWPNNPVPLTEAAPVRPNPEFSFAVEKAELERVVGAWSDEHDAATVTVLRPAPALAESGATWIGRVVQSAIGLRAGREEPRAQFLHIDDLAAAVLVVVTQRAGGTYNVAPDGWLDAEELRALRGARPVVRLPVPLAQLLDRLARRRPGPFPAGLLPYLMHPWVVANDRLRGLGWEARTTNEEAFVVADEPPPWADMNARQRQKLSLAVAGLALALVTVAIVAVVVKVRRRAT
jgi:nucleoside-diphosphate-sugar epimerase